jgi:hypothetical protein
MLRQFLLELLNLALEFYAHCLICTCRSILTVDLELTAAIANWFFAIALLVVTMELAMVAFAMRMMASVQMFF